MQWLAAVTVVVDDYDAAVAHYVGVLGFALIEDTTLAHGKRFVRVAPGGSGCALLLARAADAAQHARIGDQTGGRVGFFLHTDDFDRDHALYIARGIVFTGPPRDEAYGRVAVFRDGYRNLWDLVQPASDHAPSGSATDRVITRGV